MLPALMIGGAILGAMAGSQGSKGKKETSSLNLSPETELERQARLQQEQGFGQLDRIQREEGSRANQASQSYGDMLKQYQQTGGQPTAADLTQGRSFAEQMLAPQQNQIDLSMRQSTEQAREQAALSGRGPTDFSMNTKLAGQRSDLMSQLGAQQSSMGAQYAQQLSQNRLGFAGQFADLQQGLASQAMQNRMAIMGLGSQIQNAGRNFRATTADRMTSSPDTPGTMLSTLTGAFQGATGGAGIMNAFNGGKGNANSTYKAPDFSSGNQFSMPDFAPTRAPTSYGLGPMGGQSGGGGGSFSSPSSSFSLPDYSSNTQGYQAPQFNVMQPNYLSPMGLGAGATKGGADAYPYGDYFGQPRRR